MPTKNKFTPCKEAVSVFSVLKELKLGLEFCIERKERKHAAIKAFTYRSGGG